MAAAVTYDLTHGIATLTLNRADRKNSLSVELMDALGDNFTKAIIAVRVGYIPNGCFIHKPILQIPL